ncbi:MAG: acyltransferase, partial [Chloroflexia bacterium]
MLSTGQTETQAHTHSRLKYLPALDGLRAIAVIGVLLYHAELPLFKGGFLGVDVFFVISGYLITSLLLGEWNQSGKVDLRSFWLRRARRLLPALFLLLGVVLVFAVFFLHDEVARLRSDAIAAFGYVTNWYLIFNQQSYFETMGRPSLFQHLWSLAVEEQFYLLWPILFVLLMKFAQRFALLIVIAGALASTLLMALVYSPDIDPSRVYYGTDTRAAALLVGVALAYLLGRGSILGSLLSRLNWLREVIGAMALATVLVFFVLADESEPFLYLGGFIVLEIIVAVLIASIALPGASFVHRVLGSNVPKWLGLRSYGIYLWHWPVFMVTRSRVDVDIDGVALFILRIAITLVLAEISYRFVETPIRRGALERIWQDIKTPREQRVSLFNLRIAAILVTLLVMAATIGPAIVSARPPDAPDYLTAESINTIDPGLDQGVDPTEEPASEEEVIEPTMEPTAIAPL